VQASPVFGIVDSAGQPAGFVAAAPPVAVVPPVVVPVPPVVVVPVPPVVVPVPPVVVVPVPPVVVVPDPPVVVVPDPPLVVSEPPVVDDVPPVEDVVPPADDESSLEPPHDAVSIKPPTSIRPKPYLSAFMESSSGARVKELGPKLLSVWQ
jgi:hypothetical protein